MKIDGNLKTHRDTTGKKWPKMLTYADIKWYSKKLNRKFVPYVVKQTSANGPELIADWKAFDSHRELMPPEKHQGYAFQWFSLAFVLIILYIVLNVRKVRPVLDAGLANNDIDKDNEGL